MSEGSSDDLCIYSDKKNAQNYNIYKQLFLVEKKYFFVPKYTLILTCTPSPAALAPPPSGPSSSERGTTAARPPRRRGATVWNNFF